MKLTAESTVINDEKLNTNIDNAQATADDAKTTANEAKQVADDTAQYFWFTSTGTDTGAHISNKTQAEFISSPTGGNLLARSNGIAVRDGMTEMATFSGTQARIGKTSSSNVTITDASITMSDGTRTLYEVTNTSSGAVKVKRIYNIAFNSSAINMNDAIALGRSVSSWVANGIILTYKVNSTSYTKTYSALPSMDDTGKFSLDASLTDRTVSITFGRGETALDSEVITLVSLEFNFITTQQTVESTIGAFADKTESGAFRIGKGTASNALENAMLLNWAGDAIFSGDVVAYANADSSGGMSLTREEYSPSVFTWESSNAFIDVAVYRLGRLVTLDITASKTASTAAGANIFDANLSNARIPQPITMGATTGSAYYGSHSIGINLFYEDNWHLRIRNASSTAVTPSDMLTGTLTYICDIDPVTHAIRYTND